MLFSGFTTLAHLQHADLEEKMYSVPLIGFCETTHTCLGNSKHQTDWIH